MHLRPPPSPKFLSHFIPSRIVSPLDFSATYGFGKSSSQASSSWVLLNPEYRRLVFFKLNAREMPNRALRAAPPIWEYITLQYASNVLNLASPSQGTRSHYEKLLHERHLTIGHNQCNGARANVRPRILPVPSPSSCLLKDARPRMRRLWRSALWTRTLNNV